VSHRVSSSRLLPEHRVARANTNSILLAKDDVSRKAGVVLDYNIINSGANNVTFQSDSTYYITGTYFFGNSNIIEGDAVFKFSQTNACGLYVSSGAITCKTGPYRPAIFTSKDDDTVGEPISGSTGAPV